MNGMCLLLSLAAAVIGLCSVSAKGVVIKELSREVCIHRFRASLQPMLGYSLTVCRALSCWLQEETLKFTLQPMDYELGHHQHIAAAQKASRRLLDA